MKTALIVGGAAVGLYFLWRLGSSAGASVTASVSATGAYTPSGAPVGVPYPPVNPPNSLAGVSGFLSLGPFGTGQQVTNLHGYTVPTGGAL